MFLTRAYETESILRDVKFSQYVTLSFGDVAGKSRSAAISQLVSVNATQSVIKIIMQKQMKDVGLSDAFMVEIMWLLAQVAQRGERNIKCNLNSVYRVEVFKSL